MLLGVSEIAFSTLQTSMTNINPNAKLQVRRSYDGVFPNAWSSCKGQQDVGQKRASWISFSGPDINQINNGSFDLTLRQFFASIPITHTAMVTYKHEVNNAGKLGTNTPQQFGQAQARIWSIKQSYAKDPSMVKVGIILTAEPYRNGTFEAYYPTAGEYDFVGADPYRFWRPPGSPPDPKTGTLSQDRSMAWLLGMLPSWADSKGKPAAIGEYGAHPFPGSPANRPDWLNATDAYLRSINCLAASYFHSHKGASGPWMLDKYHVFTTDENDPLRQTGNPDPDTMNAFASLLVNNPATLN